MSAPAEDNFVNDPTSHYSMAVLSKCDRCPATAYLFVSFGGRLICADCWHAMGAPFPRRVATLEELHAAELATRERMLRRGGEAAYRVKAGKS